ncbi:MAG: Ig-like domain-containing protein [Acidobacteria bacterium]|nr:Ig-like domain-containing protein [Acidobacteriota bacterium]
MSSLPPNFRLTRLAAAWGAFVLGMLAGCGGSSSSTTSTTSTQIATIALAPTTSAITVGQNEPFTATIKNSSGTILSGGVLTWASSSTSVATIDSGGIATGMAPGTTQITASAEGVTSAAVNLIVTPKVASVQVAPASITISVGQQTQFTAKAIDSSGNTIQGAVFQWFCSASSIASIDNTGTVTGVSKGTVMITASSGGVTSAPAFLTVQ